MSEEAVADASPLILLSRTGHLDLLEILERKIIVPNAVEREIRHKGPEDVTVRALETKSYLSSGPPLAIPDPVTSWDLGAGESSVLAWASEKPGSIALLDDLEARRCAASLAIPVLGTAGLVLAAKRTGLILEARPILADLIEAGMYLSKKTLNKLLRKVDE